MEIVLFIYMAMLDNEDDRQRFERIYQTNRDFMYHYAYQILRDTASAEDAVHDAFLSFAKYYDRYRHLDEVQTRNFLIITVRNAAFKQYNHRKRETAVEDIEQDETGTMPDVAVTAEQKDVKRILFDMVKAMDSKYSDVLMMKYYYNMSINEIAEQLGLTPQNVKVRLHRGRAILKTKLEGVGIVEG